MQTVKERFNELVALAQIFVLREHKSKERLTTSPETLDFFKKRKQQPVPIQQSNKPNPLTPPTPLPPPASVASPSHMTSARPVAPLISSHRQDETSLNPLKTITQTSLPKESPPPSISESTIPSESKKAFQEKPPGKKEIILEPLPTLPCRDQGEFWKLFQTQFSTIPVSETVPSDALALKLKNAWLNDHLITPILILSFLEEGKNLAFLKNIAKAISVRFAPARVLVVPKVEKEKRWNEILNTPDIKLVIASDYSFYLQADLMSHYREESQQGKHYLKNIPLLLLSEPSLYLQEPQLKTLLWRAICNEFNSHSIQFPSL